MLGNNQQQLTILNYQLTTQILDHINKILKSLRSLPKSLPTHLSWHSMHHQPLKPAPGSSAGSKKLSDSEFICKLVDMIEKYPHVINWDEQQWDKMVVSDINEMQSHILPQYFRHGNFASFIRQLNMYSFSKLYREGNTIVFRHEIFRRGNEKNFHFIQRKKKVKEQQQMVDQFYERYKKILKRIDRDKRIKPEMQKLLKQLLEYKYVLVENIKKIKVNLESICTELKDCRTKKINECVKILRQQLMVELTEQVKIAKQIDHLMNRQISQDKRTQIGDAVDEDDHYGEILNEERVYESKVSLRDYFEECEKGQRQRKQGIMGKQQEVKSEVRQVAKKQQQQDDRNFLSPFLMEILSQPKKDNPSKSNLDQSSKLQMIEHYNNPEDNFDDNISIQRMQPREREQYLKGMDFYQPPPFYQPQQYPSHVSNSHPNYNHSISHFLGLNPSVQMNSRMDINTSINGENTHSNPYEMGLANFPSHWSHHQYHSLREQNVEDIQEQGVQSKQKVEADHQERKNLLSKEPNEDEGEVKSEKGKQNQPFDSFMNHPFNARYHSYPQFHNSLHIQPSSRWNSTTCYQPLQKPGFISMPDFQRAYRHQQNQYRKNTQANLFKSHEELFGRQENHEMSNSKVNEKKSNLHQNLEPKMRQQQQQKALPQYFQDSQEKIEQPESIVADERKDCQAQTTSKARSQNAPKISSPDSENKNPNAFHSQAEQFRKCHEN